MGEVGYLKDLGENDDPQPQVKSAFGFSFTINTLLMSSWVKSIVEPSKIVIESLSTTSFAPSLSIIKSFSRTSLEISNLYMNPPQPAPPSTISRRNSDSLHIFFICEVQAWVNWIEYLLSRVANIYSH